MLDPGGNQGVGRISDRARLGCPQIPTYCINRPAQVTAAGMALCAMSCDTGIGPEFKEVEWTIAKTFFLPALFGDSYDDDTDLQHQFICLPVKWVGLAIPLDPSWSAELNHDVSVLFFSFNQQITLRHCHFSSSISGFRFWHISWQSVQNTRNVAFSLGS
jgi:hypothetical protein